MAKQREFPKVPGHTEVRCRQCHRPLPGSPLTYASTEGKFGKVCNKCYLITWYDLEPKQVFGSFDPSVLP